MGSFFNYSKANREIVDGKLVAIGKRLAQLPSSSRELRTLLEDAESVLGEVCQYPPDSTAKAVAPVMKALLSNKIFEQTDIDIKMAHAACMNETIRVSLPEPPFEDVEMKSIFQLFMVALKELSGDVDSKNYKTAYQILRYMAQLRTSLIVLDLEHDKMVVDLFQLLFDLIDPNHTSKIFEFMETAMALMIEEIDDISLALVETLLSSVKLDKKDTSPMSWELGKTVLEKSVTRLQPHVKEVVKMKNLDAKDYADIISSLCRDALDGKNTVEGEAEETVKPTGVDISSVEAAVVEGISTEVVKDGAAEAKDGNQNIREDQVKGEAGETVKPTGVDLSSVEASVVEGISQEEVKDGPAEVKDGNQNIKEDENMLEGLKCCESRSGGTRSDTQEADNSGSGTNLETGQQSEINNLTSRTKRGRKPNSLLRPEEGYTFTWAMGGLTLYKFSEDIIKEKKDSPSPSGPGKDDVPVGSSRKESDSIEESSTRKRGRSMNAESVVSQQSEPEPVVAQKRKDVAQANVKEGNSNSSKKGKRKPKKVSGTSEVSIVKEEPNLSGNDSEGENELVKKPRRKRLTGDGNTSKKPKKKNVADKTEESSVFESAKDKSAESSVSDKEKESGRASVEYGEEMVNLRIMVWWPMDKTFYTGTIVSYDPALKKHKVIYDDDEEEVLNLTEERWELFNEAQTRKVRPPLEEDTNRQYPAKQATKTPKKGTQKRGGSSRKPASSSSKRSRNGGRDEVKSENEDRERSESNDEASETYFS